MGRAVKDGAAPRFGSGDRVGVLVGSPPRHIRTPVYVQGKVGVVDKLYGAFGNPESLAYGGSGLEKVPLYRVRFQQRDVWRDYNGSAGDTVCVDIYEHRLEPDKVTEEP